jgi:hypothetical protein
MTALTPGCDPDMSISGAPFGATATTGPRLRSGAVLLAFVALAVLLVSADAPAASTVPVAVVGAFCAVALVGRGVRLAHRTGSAAVTSVARAAHRSRTVPSATP